MSSGTSALENPNDQIGALSLKKQSTKKFVHFLTTDSKDAVDQFIGGNQITQTVMLTSLKDELVRLKAIESQWNHLERRCPEVDLALWSKPYNRMPPLEDGKHELDENASQNVYKDAYEGNPDRAYAMRKKFGQIWSYQSDDASHNQNCTYLLKPSMTLQRTLRLIIQVKQAVSWGPYDFDCQLNGPIVAIRQESGMISFPKRTMYKRISTQLLLYRLFATFGMSDPARTDEYKSCWDCNLVHKDGSSANIGEHKG
jgi:hypothetical protein